jgi:predicted enzyme related to lactoylglutathione lyase
MPHPVVHLELRTANLPSACAFYARLLGWHAQTVHAGAGSYVVLDAGEGIGLGVVEHDAAVPSWLPYIEITDIAAVTERACLLGAAVLLEPREGPAGWRGVLRAPAGEEIALWQPKL